MPRPLALLSPLLLGLVFTPGEPVALPNGTDPAQFELVGIAADSIGIVDGEVRLTGKPLGYFATKRDYKDYVLTFEFRYDRPEDLKSDADFRGNSGVLLHITGPAKVWPGCVQVQLAQFDPGAIFPMDESKCEPSTNPLAQKGAIKPVGEWSPRNLAVSLLEFASRDAGLTDDRHQRADPQLRVVRHWDGGESIGQPTLHDDMATAATYFHEAVASQDLADFAPGEDA